MLSCWLLVNNKDVCVLHHANGDDHTLYLFDAVGNLLNSVANKEATALTGRLNQLLLCNNTEISVFSVDSSGGLTDSPVTSHILSLCEEDDGGMHDVELHNECSLLMVNI